ncbi:MAG: hypothetical protein AB8E15_13860 [Bdellovibrionales bacterium]
MKREDLMFFLIFSVLLSCAQVPEKTNEQKAKPQHLQNWERYKDSEVGKELDGLKTSSATDASTMIHRFIFNQES